MKFIPTLGGEFSGAAGGIVASRNKGGAYLRRRAVPTNPNTALQQARRSGLAAAAINWGNLTDAQRSAWAAYAAGTPTIDRIGQTIILSGQQAYVRVKAAWLAYNAAAQIDEDAPATPGLSRPLVRMSPDPVTPDRIIWDPVAEEWQADLFFAEEGTASAAFSFFISDPLPPGVNYFKGPYQALGPIAWAATAVNATTTAQAPFPLRVPLAGGQRRGVRVRGVDVDNRISPEYTTILEVIAV